MGPRETGREGEGEVLPVASCLAPPYLNCTVCFALAAGHGEKETLAEEEKKEQPQVDVVLVGYLISLRRSFFLQGLLLS